MLRRPSNGALSDFGEKVSQATGNPMYTQLSTQEMDTGAHIVAGLSSELDAVEAAQIRFVPASYGISIAPNLEITRRKKTDYHILPMMMMMMMCSESWRPFSNPS